MVLVQLSMEFLRNCRLSLDFFRLQIRCADSVIPWKKKRRDYICADVSEWFLFEAMLNDWICHVIARI